MSNREVRIRKRRLLREPPPDPATVARIDQLEADPALGGMDLAEAAEYLRGLLPGRVHGFDASLPADEPTSARPGTPEKLRVMAERAERGEALFHPRDARLLPHHEEMI